MARIEKMMKASKLFKGAIFGATLGLLAGAMPALSGEHGGKEAEVQSWTFAGLFGTYDVNQLQRGFQVFREVCSGCHSARLLAFRNLSEEGGPSFSEDQVKALAAEYTITDPELEEGERPAVPADRWPDPFATELDAKASNGGIVPPDFSVLAKGRGIKQKFPYWAFNYFTAYQEGGPDFIYNLLVNFEDAPHGVDVPDGKYWNSFLGTAIAMPPPLFDGAVDYQGDSVPETVDQYSRDVAAFMMWMADPHLASRKQAGFRVLTFLFLFAGLMYLVKRKLWSDVAH